MNVHIRLEEEVEYPLSLTDLMQRDFTSAGHRVTSLKNADIAVVSYRDVAIEVALEHPSIKIYLLRGVDPESYLAYAVEEIGSERAEVVCYCDLLYFLNSKVPYK